MKALPPGDTGLNLEQGSGQKSLVQSSPVSRSETLHQVGVQGRPFHAGRVAAPRPARSSR